MKVSKFLKNIGPGAFIAAAFIGPGTVTICSVAGANFKFSLFWALLISIIATMILQEMATRLGLISRKGLAKAIRTAIKSRALRIAVVTLMIAAIIIGDSAYQAGNISGGILGLSTFVPPWEMNLSGNSYNLWPLTVGGIAFILLYIGNYKVLGQMLRTNSHF